MTAIEKFALLNKLFLDVAIKQSYQIYIISIQKNKQTNKQTKTFFYFRLFVYIFYFICLHFVILFVFILFFSCFHSLFLFVCLHFVILFLFILYFVFIFGLFVFWHEKVDYRKQSLIGPTKMWIKTQYAF